MSADATTPKWPLTKRPRSHPADITANRLHDDVLRWADKFTPAERDAIGEIIHALREIADGER